MQDQSSNSAQMIKAQYVMRRSASPAPGLVANLARDQVNNDSSQYTVGSRDDAPSVRVLARADHTRERGAVQQRIVVPEDREREERAVRHDQMRRRREGLRLLLLLPLLLSRETGG